MSNFCQPYWKKKSHEPLEILLDLLSSTTFPSAVWHENIFQSIMAIQNPWTSFQYHLWSLMPVSRFRLTNLTPDSKGQSNAPSTKSSNVVTLSMERNQVCVMLQTMSVVAYSEYFAYSAIPPCSAALPGSSLPNFVILLYLSQKYKRLVVHIMLSSQDLGDKYLS